MQEVKWKFNGFFKADPSKCLQEIGEDSVTPEQVLEKARDEKSELHKYFEWDDSIAAEKYRLYQARQLIQFLVIIPKTQETPAIRYFQITSEENKYMPTRKFLQNKDERATLLLRAKAELVSFRERYRTLSELENVFEEIDKL